MTAANLKQVAEELGEEFTEEDLAEMVDEASRYRGGISMRDFLRVCRRRGEDDLDDDPPEPPKQ